MVDLRARRAFAAGHVASTLSFDLDGSFATYMGWLIPWRTPLTLLGQTPEQVAEAQRELVRIGIDRPAAAATGHPADWAGGRALRSYPVADFADLEAVRRHRPGRAPRLRMGRLAYRRRRAHSAAPAARPPGRGARRGRCGCTARRDTGPRSQPRSRTPRAGRLSRSTTSMGVPRAGLPAGGLLSQMAAK